MERHFTKKPVLIAVQKRMALRHRSYLRLGKLLDLRNQVLAECTFYDLSDGGARVTLLANVPLPQRIQIFDAVRGHMRIADIVWRDTLDIGLRFATQPLCLSKQEIEDLSTTWDCEILAKIFMPSLASRKPFTS